jgi:hypothetical protein
VTLSTPSLSAGRLTANSSSRHSLTARQTILVGSQRWNFLDRSRMSLGHGEQRAWRFKYPILHLANMRTRSGSFRPELRDLLPRTVEHARHTKTALEPPWKTLRVSHTSTAWRRLAVMSPTLRSQSSCLRPSLELHKPQSCPPDGH